MRVEALLASVAVVRHRALREVPALVGTHDDAAGGEDGSTEQGCERQRDTESHPHEARDHITRCAWHGRVRSLYTQAI